MRRVLELASVVAGEDGGPGQGQAGVQARDASATGAGATQHLAAARSLAVARRLGSLTDAEFRKQVRPLADAVRPLGPAQRAQLAAIIASARPRRTVADPGEDRRPC